ncbi:MAG: class I SAM-dependent methyltransferase [Desulfobacterales bacterium]|nr:MAG: class I SAM-dependent methyltransferase [Desulfobacterales bacterium]
MFDRYAHYYDLLYHEKDYRAEASYIDQLIKNHHHRHSKTVLDLGCGTGNHALCLAEKGYEVTGIDASAVNIASAIAKCSTMSPGMRGLHFREGDIRNVRLEQKFDVVICLFHVINYQVSDADLLATVLTAKTHLKGGGIFIFDCWYGPAVLNDPPTVRVKRVEDAACKITRIAEPSVLADKNTVVVNYQLFIENRTTGEISQVCEQHHMRYLFQSELGDLFQQTGFRPLVCREWMTDKKPGSDTWNVYFISRSTGRLQ